MEHISFYSMLTMLIYLAKTQNTTMKNAEFLIRG